MLQIVIFPYFRGNHLNVKFFIRKQTTALTDTWPKILIFNLKMAGEQYIGKKIFWSYLDRNFVQIRQSVQNCKSRFINASY